MKVLVNEGFISLFQMSFFLCPGGLGVFLHTKKALPTQSYEESLLEEDKSWDTSTQNCAKCADKDSKVLHKSSFLDHWRVAEKGIRFLSAFSDVKQAFWWAAICSHPVFELLATYSWGKFSVVIGSPDGGEWMQSPHLGSPRKAFAYANSHPVLQVHPLFNNHIYGDFSW